MSTREEFIKAALRLYEFCEYPAVRYKILFHLLDTPYDDEKLSSLRPAFHKSDIVDELDREQDYNGGWGKLQSKDYSAKDKFPTSMTAINRCLYIGLTIEDRDILLLAYEYLEEFLNGTSKEKLYNKNERAIPWQTASICNYINQFRGSALYLADSVNWLMENQNENGLWDWGTQVKDPWGYFGYFSTNRNHKHNRVVDCTMEVLTFLKKYLDNNN